VDPLPDPINGRHRPPSDPEDWSDEQWIEWLEETDDEAPAPSQPSRSPKPRVLGSSGGQILGNAMVGVANALYGRKEDPVVVVQEASGPLEEDEPFELHLDPEHPEDSHVVVHRRRRS